LQVYILIGLVFAWIVSGLMADNYALRKHLKEYKRLEQIDLERYNYVVDLLTEEQHRELRQWYIATGAIKEE